MHKNVTAIVYHATQDEGSLSFKIYYQGKFLGGTFSLIKKSQQNLQLAVLNEFAGSEIVILILFILRKHLLLHFVHYHSNMNFY